MTVYVVHAPGAAALAGKIARAFERDGIFVETEDASRGFAPLQGRDVVVLVWSEEMRGEPAGPALIARGLEGWTLDRLVIAVIDGEPPPPAFADQPLIAVSAAEAGRRIAEAVAARLETLAPLAPQKRIQSQAGAPERRGTAFYALAALAAVLALAAASVHAWTGSSEALLAALAASVVMLPAAAAGIVADRRAKPPERPPASVLAVAGQPDLRARLIEALRETGASGFDVEANRTGMARADGLVIALDASGDGAQTSPTLRALLLAEAVGKPFAVLRAGSPDTVRALPAMLQGAPNAAWPGEPRAAAALARALIDQASGAPP